MVHCFGMHLLPHHVCLCIWIRAYALLVLCASLCVCVWVSDSPDLFNMLVKPELLSQSRHACVNSSTPTWRSNSLLLEYWHTRTRTCIVFPVMLFFFINNVLYALATTSRKLTLQNDASLFSFFLSLFSSFWRLQISGLVTVVTITAPVIGWMLDRV